MSSMNRYRVIICVMGCDKYDKYINQLRLIINTWGQLCPNDVKVLYFLGEKSTPEFSGPDFINLPGVSDDHLSASYKQFLGLKYIYENYDAEFIHAFGSDTYVNIPKLLKFLSHFDPTKSLYIGGHGCHRKIYDKTYYFHSGGPGFIITKPCLAQLYPMLSDIMTTWKDITVKSGVFNELYWACDFAISYFLQQENMNVEIIKADDLVFTHCNYLGHPCHQNQIDLKKLVSCHCMSPEDYANYTKLLHDNNFFLE
jgi:hypothetical protein